MFNNAEQLKNTLLNIYFIQYNNIADKGHMDKKYDPERVKSRRQTSNHKDLLEMKLLEIDENEVKEGKGLKVLTPNKLLTRLPIYTN